MNKFSNPTGFVVIKLSALILISGTLMSTYAPEWKLLSEEVKMGLPVAVSSDSMKYADCLWYAARNHGFYRVQKKIADNHSSPQNMQLWKQFVESIGQDECGAITFSLTELSHALASTVTEADHYFLTQRKL